MILYPETAVNTLTELLYVYGSIEGCPCLQGIFYDWHIEVWLSVYKRPLNTGCFADGIFEYIFVNNFFIFWFIYHKISFLKFSY